MKRNSRLSSTLHLLVHVAEAPDRSADLRRACRLRSHNPVVVRRTIAELTRRGIVISSRGHGGGWQRSAGRRTGFRWPRSAPRLARRCCRSAPNRKALDVWSSEAVIAVLDDFHAWRRKGCSRSSSAISRWPT
ncbi:Rrf2 family transcriptional regulator [Mesorhizobium atlanticum]